MPWNPEQYQQGNKMPTEREYDQHNEIKKDSPPANRLRFLDRVESIWLYPLAWLSPGPCKVCFAIRLTVLALAIVGLFSIIF